MSGDTRRARKLLSAVALIAAPLLWASGAHAGLLAEYSTDGGVTFTPICSGASGTSCSATLTTSNGLALTVDSAQSNSPGTGSLSQVLSAALQILNTTGATQTVELLVGDIGFTMPVTPPSLTLESAIGDTVVVGGAANLLSYRSCIDQADGQNVCPGTNSTAFVTPSITAIGSSNSSDTTIISSLHAPYSMTEELTLTLSAASELNYSASSRLTSNIPEPASLAVLGSTLIGLGLIRRRRRM